MVVRETFKPTNAGFPGPQTRGAPKRPDLTKTPAWTIGPHLRIMAGMWKFAENPPPDMCDWDSTRALPGPGQYSPKVEAVKPSSLRTDFAPPLHWPDTDGIPAGDLLRKNRMPAQRELYTPAVDSRRILRESLAPTRQRALSETHSAYPTGGRPTLPAVKANLSTFRGDLTGSVDQLARSWHGCHHKELRAAEQANATTQRDTRAPPFGADILKPRAPIKRTKAADLLYITPREMREHNWDCRSIRHPREPTAYQGRVGEP